MQPTLRTLFRKAYDAKLACASAAANAANDAALGPIRTADASGPSEFLASESAQPTSVPEGHGADAPSAPADRPQPGEERRCAGGRRVVQTFKRQKGTAKRSPDGGPGTAEPPQLAEACAGDSAAAPSSSRQELALAPLARAPARDAGAGPGPGSDPVKAPAAPAPPRMKQLYLDLGQAGFFHSRCPDCGLCYARGLPSEDALHAAHHANYLAGVSFKGWSSERVAWTGADGARIVAVSPADPPSRVAKMREVGDVMEKALGLQPGWLFSSPPEGRAVMLLYVVGKRVRGALVTERIASAFRAAPRSGAALPAAALQERQRREAEERLTPTLLALAAAEQPECLDGPADDEGSTGRPPLGADETGRPSGRTSGGAGAAAAAAGAGAGLCAQQDGDDSCGGRQSAGARQQEQQPADSGAGGSCSWGAGAGDACCDGDGGDEVSSGAGGADAGARAGCPVSTGNDALPCEGPVASGGGRGGGYDAEAPSGGCGRARAGQGIAGDEEEVSSGAHRGQAASVPAPAPGSGGSNRGERGSPCSSASGDLGGSSHLRKRRRDPGAAGEAGPGEAAAAEGAGAAPEQGGQPEPEVAGAREREPFSEPLERETEPVPAELGIRAIWVHPSVRRSGVARKLLNAARACAVPGYVVPIDAVAFTQPTEMGAALAACYTGTLQFLVYG